MIRRDFSKWPGTAGFSRGATWTLWRGGAKESDVVPWNSHHDEGTFIAMSFPYGMGVSYGSMGVMWVKQCHKPLFFEWFIPSRKMLMTGGWCKWHCFPDFSPYQFHQSMWNQTDEDDAFRSKNFKLLSPNIWALNADRNAERNAMRKERGGACLHDVWV